MLGWWTWLVVAGLFAFGLRLSAFFSGSEIGFYRVSPLRLSIEADSGDRISQRLLMFVQRPGYFVATTLVGNNVANYITTLAIAMGTTALFGSASGATEIVSTLFMTPVVFVFGELLPKNLYYEAPHRLLRRDAAWFWFFYRAFLVVSSPLVWLSNLIERIGSREHGPPQLALGRKRLVQVLSEGHQEGLLSQVQNHLVHGLLRRAPQAVTGSMTAIDHVLGLEEDASREEVNRFAYRYGRSLVPIRPTGSIWSSYVRVADISMHDGPIKQDLHPLVRIEASAGKLEALLAMRAAGEAYGAVWRGNEIIGLIMEFQLIEEFFTPQQAAVAG